MSMEELPTNEQPQEEEEVQSQEVALLPVIDVTRMDRIKYFAGAAFGIGGVTELLGMGSVGLLLAAIGGSAAAYFSEEIRGIMMDFLPAPQHASTSRSSKWSWWLTGSTNSQSGQTTRGAEHDHHQAERTEEEETLVKQTVERDTEPQVAVRSQPPREQHAVFGYSQERTLRLATNFQTDVDTILGEGIVVFGVKGAGKTNTGALLAEQFGRFYVPMAIFDKEGDYQSLTSELRRACIAISPTYAEHGHLSDVLSDVRNERLLSVGQENAFQAGYDLMEFGYQIIFALSTYADDEECARLMIDVIAGMKAWAEAHPPEERVPAIVHLDEAAYWLPQDRSMTLLSNETLGRLLHTFVGLATTGRKRGLTPLLLSQRIADLHKAVMAQATIYIIMKQSLDIDLDRATKIIAAGTKEQIASLGPGQAVVKLADGTQFLTQFYQRRSVHRSHTPKASDALRRYAARSQALSSVARIPHGGQTITAELPAVVTTEMLPTPTGRFTSVLSPDLQRALDAYNAGHTSYRTLGAQLGIDKDAAGRLIRQLKDRKLISA